MKIMCDTNIILDVLLDRPPFADASCEVLSLCQNGKLEGLTTASCITDIFYIVHKHLHNADQAYNAIEKIVKILPVCSVTSISIHEALRKRARDFEDCLVAVCAKEAQCDYVVTRDPKGFADCNIPILSPEELLEKIQ